MSFKEFCEIGLVLRWYLLTIPIPNSHYACVLVYVFIVIKFSNFYKFIRLNIII
jgi:hypothetical protein